ncbi:uncharacterized protein [Haliotis cracherodii]|uniref:uncharacterized protein n=1 Tax=Haliotis cracherodii TaxID=6455 RepID=UPI0039EA7BB2
MDARAVVVLLCALLWRKSTASPLHPGGPCPTGDITVAPNFTFSQVAGVWYISERTTSIWGEATWTSQVWNFVLGHDGTMVVVITGNQPANSRCADPLVGLLESTSIPGSFRYMKQDAAILKVVTVTDTAAIFYVCFKMEDGGTCPVEQQMVVFASRDLSMTIVDRQSLVEHLNDLCIGEEDVSSTQQGLCKIPHTNASLVSSSVFDGTTPVFSIAQGKQRVLTLTCSITRPQLVTRVSWSKVSETSVRQLTGGTQRFVSDSRVSVSQPFLKDWNLRIANFGAMESDGGVYVCMNDKQEIRKYLVSIMVPPHIEASVETVTVAAGDSVTLECDVAGTPTPAVSWYIRKNNTHQNRRCGDAQVDLVFILETSSEFGLFNFNLALDFVRFYLVHSDINGGNVRVGFMTFNDEAHVEFQMSDYCDKKQLYLALLRLQHRGGAANVSEAIHVARTQMFLPHHGNRKHVADAIILMTVGRVNDDASHILSEATAAKNSGIHMYVVQSSLAHTAEVGAIASTPVEENRFSLAQFQELKELRNSMFKSHCPGPSPAGGHSLTFMNVYWANIGQYICHAHNDIQPDASQTFYLQVNFSPEVSVNAEEVRKAIGQSMTFECEVKANPRPTIEWEHMGSYVRDNYRHSITRRSMDNITTVSTLHVEHIESEDFGRYFCIAENSVGTMRAAVQLTERTADQCAEARTQVQRELNVNGLLGEWQRVKAIPYLYGNNTYISETVKYFLNTDGQLSSAYHGKLKNADACAGPGVSVLTEEYPGKYFSTNGKFRELFQFVFTDYTNAVLYMCLEVDDSGHCQKENLHIEIITKQFPIPTSKMAELEQIVSNLCVDVEDMIEATPGLCAFPEGFLESVGDPADDVGTSHCDQARRRVQEEFNVYDFLGTWHRVKTTPYYYGDQTYRSWTMQFFINGGGSLSSAYISQNNNVCSDPGVFLLEQESPGKYIHSYQEYRELFQFVFTDYTNAVLYMCREVDVSGHCQKENLHVEIITKQFPIPTSKMAELEQIVSNLCVDVEDMIEATPGRCEFPEGYLKSVGYDTNGVNQDYMCQVERTRVQANFNASQFVGEWQVMKTTTFRGDRETFMSETINYFLSTTGNLVLAFSGLNPGSEICLPPNHLKLTEAQPGQYTAHIQDNVASIQIVYTDYNYAVTISCSNASDNGQCPHQHMSVQIIARQNPVPDNIMHNLERYADALCINVDDMRVNVPDLCEIPVTYLVTAGYHSAEFCMLEKMPIQKNFDKNRFLGMWNIIKTSPNIYSGRVYLTAIQDYFLKDDGAFTTAYRGYIQGSSTCLEPGTILFKKDSHGDYVFKTMTGQGTFKIIYTDYKYAVTYSCRQVGNDGWCLDGLAHTSILAREDIVDPDTMTLLESYAQRTCVDLETMVHVDPELCSIPPEYLESVGYSGPDRCQVTNIPIQPHFSLSRFLGKWNTLRILTYYYGNKTYTSMTHKYFLNADDRLTLVFRGYNKSSQLCADSRFVSLDQRSRGYFVLPHNETFQVVYTDYEYAIVYICGSLQTDGHCLKQKTQVAIMSRHNSITDELLHQLQAKVADLCVDVGDLIDVDPGVCLISAADLDTAGYTGPPEDECQLTGITHQEDINTTMLQGEWYTVMSTPSSGQLSHESLGPAYFHFEGWNLVRLYRGINNKSSLCAPTEAVSLTEVTAPGDYYHHANSVAFRILHACPMYMVTYTCMEEGEDGTCADAWVNILARSKVIPANHIVGLKKYVTHACLDSNTLRNNEKLECRVPSVIVQAAMDDLISDDHSVIGCHSDFVPVQADLDIHKFADTMWFTLWRSSSMWGNTSLVPSSRKQIVLAPVEDESDDVFLLTRSYKSSWESCEPVEVLKLTESEQPGDYTISFGDSSSLHGMYRIVYADDEYAVTYSCFDTTMGDSCPSDSRLVEIMSVHAVVDEQRLNTLMDYVNNVCADVSTMAQTEPAACSIPQSIIDAVRGHQVTTDYALPIAGCNDNLITVDPNFDLTTFTGVWNLVYSTNYMKWQTEESSLTLHIAESDSGILFSRKLYSPVSEQCLPTETGSLVERSGAGDYSALFADEPVMMKVLHLEDTVAVTYICLFMQEDGTCRRDSLSINFLSRSEDMTEEDMELLQGYVEGTCAEREDIIKIRTGLCKIPIKIQDAADQGELTADFSVVECSMDFIQTQDVSLQQLRGLWYTIAKNEYFLGEKRSERELGYITPYGDGSQGTYLFSIYNNSKCSLTESFKVTWESQGTFKLLFGTLAGNLKVLYLDDKAAVMYYCFQHKTDGTCSDGFSSFEIMSRETSLPAEMLDRLKKYAENVCDKVGDRVWPSSPCTISEQLQQAASSGELTQDYVVAECMTKFIPVQDNFDFKRFSGSWHTIAKTQHIWGDRSWASEIRDFHVSQDDHLFCSYRGYDKDVQGCRPTEFMHVKDTSTPGHFTYMFRDMAATLKVIYTDYTNAVVYWCLGANPDGTCKSNKIQVEIISKNLRVDKETRTQLEEYIRHGCVRLSDIQDSDLDLCQIPSSISQAALAGEITSDYIKVQCMDKFISAQRNFDMNRLTGDWYTVAGTHYAWGNNTWDNFIRRIQILDDGSTVMAYTGYRNYGASCAPAESVELTQRGHPGHFVFIIGGIEMIMRVVYTNYEVAVLYTCYGFGTDGTCPRNKLTVEVLSREKGIEDATLTSMYFYVSNLCVEIDDLVTYNYNLCEAPEVDEDSIQRKICTFDDIPLTPNFVFLQMAGLWYEVARTRFTFNKMESSVLFYRYQADTGHLDGLYTGSMKGFCQDPLSSLTKLHTGNHPDAYLLGRLGGKDSVYPWFSFKIIHFDGKYLMYYACYTTSDDGTCPRDKTEVTLLGREQGLNDEIRSQIPALMRGMCLKPADLVTSMASVDCTSYLFPDFHNSPAGDNANKECSPLAAMSVTEDIDDRNLVGKWRSAVDIGFGMDGQSRSFNITIRRHTDKTFKMNLEQRGDNRFTNYSVMLKPRCDSFSHGDYISSLGSTVMGQWSSLKVFHSDDNTLLLYWCLKEQSNGTCHSSGIRVLLLARDLPLEETLKQNVLGKIQDVCVTPPPPAPLPVLQGVIPGAVLGMRARQSPDDRSDYVTPSIYTSFCAIDNIPTINISQELHSGLWYEIARTPDPMLTMDSTIGYYLPVGGGNMKMVYSGMTPDGQCKGPMFGDLRPRCPHSIDGNYQGRIKMPRMWLWTSWKVLYTDYDHAMLAMSCMDEDDNGLCTTMGTKMHIMSRNHTISPDLRNKLNLLVQSACVNPSSLVDTTHDGSCRGNVEAAVEKLKAEL